MLPLSFEVVESILLLFVIEEEEDVVDATVVAGFLPVAVFVAQLDPGIEPPALPELLLLEVVLLLLLLSMLLLLLPLLL